MRTSALLRSMAVGLLGAILTATPALADDETFTTATAAPAVVSGPSSPDNDLAPSWTFSAPDVASFECSLSRDDTVVGDWVGCSSPTAYDLSTQPDGLYTFAVRAIGLDGSVSDPVASPYRLDTSVPGLPTITALPGPVAADRSPRWTFTGGTAESLECRLDRGDQAIAGWAPCTSPQEFDLSGQPDGAYTFSLRGVGQNGVRGPGRTADYLLDTVAPDAPQISSPPPAVGSTRTVKLAFDAEAGAQVECRRTGGDVDGSWKPCTSPRVFDLSGRPDATYTLALRAIDAAGNVGDQVAVEHTLDTTAPAPPEVTSPSVTPATKLQPNFTFATSDGDAYECRLDGPGGYATGWQSCTSPAPYDLTGQPNGLYAFSVRGTDAAGNTGEPGTASYELIRNPRAVDLRSGPGRVGNARRPQWTFQVDGAASFKCSLAQGTTELFKPATCGSPRTYNLAGRPDGTYTFTVQATSSNGEAREGATQDYELDSTPPARPAIESSPVSPAADTTPAWRFSGDGGAALDCRVTQGSDTVVDWTACTNPKPFDLGQGKDGDYRVTVRARDAAGNLSAPQTTVYELDTTPPATPAVTAAPKAEDVDRSPTWAFEGEDDAVFTCTLTRGTTVVAAESSCDDTKTYNLSGAVAGTYTFTVQATDAAGNTSPGKTTRYVLAKAPATTGGSGAAGSGSPGEGAGPGSGSSSGSDGLVTAGPGTSGPETVDPETVDPGSPGPAGDDGRPTASSGVRAPARSSAAPRSGGDRTGARAAAGDSTRASSPSGPARTSSSRVRDDDGTSRAADLRGDDRGADADRGLGAKAKDAVGGIGRGTARALTGKVGRTVFPMSLLIVLGGFLLLQGRIDRGDPKLAMAPIDGEPTLKFEPPPTRR